MTENKPLSIILQSSKFELIQYRRQLEELWRRAKKPEKRQKYRYFHRLVCGAIETYCEPSSVQMTDKELLAELGLVD